MSTLLVKNISTLITNDDKLGDIKDGAIFVENNEIKQVGQTSKLPQTADIVIDAKDKMVCPGFVNTHHHFYQTLTRAVPGAMDEKLFEDYYRDSCAISKEDLISFMKASTSYELKEGFSRCGAKVAVYAGEKETAGILRSARRTAECLPGTALTILPGLYHGQFSMNTPEVYALTVRKLIES